MIMVIEYRNAMVYKCRNGMVYEEKFIVRRTLLL